MTPKASFLSIKCNLGRNSLTFKGKTENLDSKLFRPRRYEGKTSNTISFNHFHSQIDRTLYVLLLAINATKKIHTFYKQKVKLNSFGKESSSLYTMIKQQKTCFMNNVDILVGRYVMYITT